MLRKVLIIGLFYLGLMPHLQAATDVPPIPLFDATYGVYALGMQIAEGGRHLRALGDGRYRFYTTVKAVGIAALVRDDQIEETTTWRWLNGQFQAEKYYFLQQNGQKRRFRQAVFDWTSRTVDSWKDEQHWRLPLEVDKQPVLDKILVQLALMRDLQQQADLQQRHYWVVNKEAIVQYRLQAKGQESIETDAGRFQTVKFLRRSSKNPARYSYLWCAPRLSYLPVQIEHTEPNGSTIRIRLLSLKGLDGLIIAGETALNPQH